MSDLTGSIPVEEHSDASSPTLRDFAAASSEVHRLAALTAAMMDARQAGAAYERRVEASRRARTTVNSASRAGSSPPVSTSVGEGSGVLARRRRSSSRTRLRSTSVTRTSATGTSATSGALAEELSTATSPANHPRSRGFSGNSAQGINVRAGQRTVSSEAFARGAVPTSMGSLRRHVDELYAQLRLARAKQETDAKLIRDLQQDNGNLKHLVESASEVSEAASASLRELTRSRRTCDELRLETDGLQRRAMDAERRCTHLQELLRDTEARMLELEQRAVRAEQALQQSNERISQRPDETLEAISERIQSAERRATRSEQAAAQEQARAADAVQRAIRAEAATEKEHERSLDAERRAARAEHLLEELRAQLVEVERQLAQAKQTTEAEAARAVEAERRAAGAEQAVVQERDRAVCADRRVARAEDEAEQARALAAEADRRAALAEDAIEEGRARAEAAERRAARAEQEAEETRQLALEAERRAVRATQGLDELERRAIRAEEAQQEAEERVRDADRRAVRASQLQAEAEVRTEDAERRAARAEQASQDAQARVSEFDRRTVRAEQARSEALACLSEAERRAALAEQAAENAMIRIADAENRAARAELAAQQDRQAAADADCHTAHAQQALEQSQADALAAERRAIRAEKALEEASAQAEELQAHLVAAEARAARAEQLVATEGDRAQEEARHAARMETAALQDQERAREAEDRTAAAVARAQQAEKRVAVAEGHAAALEERLQQARTLADAADARAAEVERRRDRLAAECRELRQQLHIIMVQLGGLPDAADRSRLRSRTRHQNPDLGRSPRRITSAASAATSSRRSQDGDGQDLGQSPMSPGRWAQPVPDPRVRPLTRTGHGDVTVAFSPTSTPRAVPGSGGARSQLWADANTSPALESESGNNSVHRPAESGSAAQPSRLGGRAADDRDNDLAGPAAAELVARDRDSARSSPSLRLSQALVPGTSPSPRSRAVVTLEQYLDGNTALADELRTVRGELRNARHELSDLKSQYRAACSRVQQLEEQTALVENMKAKLNRMAAQARNSERLAAEARNYRSQLAEFDNLQLDLRKAQAELSEAHGVRAALEDARAQLVEMERVRSESRRINASLQTVTRERDAARNELAEASAQLVGLAALRAQLQRAEAAAAEAEQGREEARAAAAAATAQADKLKAQLATAEEELEEALRRCTRLQDAADEAAHQRDRAQAALGGAEGALQAAEKERDVLMAEQERLKGKTQELTEVQDEIRSLKAQLQEAAAAQRRTAQAEQEARARAEEAQEQVTSLKGQLAQAAAAQVDGEALQQQLQAALAQVQSMKGDLTAAADKLQHFAKLQADLAANAERADKAESQLRVANEEFARVSAEAERLNKELAEARQSLAKSHEEESAATALAASRGSRTADLERELARMREASYQLEVDVARMTTELHRLRNDLASASDMIEEATTARNQLSDQLAEANKQLARSTAAAAAAEERLKADMQQMQVRLAASEAECRSMQHSNGTLHDEIERLQAEARGLQGHLQDESRAKEEQFAECRRLQRELELASDGLSQSQRAQRSAAASAADLEAEVDRLQDARNALESEVQAATARVQRLQEEAQELTERNSELATQLHGLSSTVRQLEAENARLADGHATLTVEVEARAAEVRAARGEAAELAADRASLTAELQTAREQLEVAKAERSDLLNRMSSSTEFSPRRDPRITITGGGIPPVSGNNATKPLAVLFGDPLAQYGTSQSPPAQSPTGTSDDLQALLVAPIDTGALLAGTGDMSQYEALLAALDEEAQQLDEELAGKEASSTILLQRMRATKQAVTARMDALQAQLQTAREAESEVRREAADKDVTILKLQQQLTQLIGMAKAPGTADSDAASESGPGGAALQLGFGTDVLQGNVVIAALRQDLDAAHDRLRDAGRQLREAQQRAETAESEVSRLREAMSKSRSELSKLHGELAANDRVLADAETALSALAAKRDGLEQQLRTAREAERQALVVAEDLKAQVASLHSQLEATLDAAAFAAPPETETSGSLAGTVHDRMVNYLQSLGNGDSSCQAYGAHAVDAANGRAPLVSIGIGPSPAAVSTDTAASEARARTSVTPAAGRYTVCARTSETGSGSTISASQPGAHTEFWEGLSTSGWDNSGGSVLGTAPGVLLSPKGMFGIARPSKNLSATPRGSDLVAATSVPQLGDTTGASAGANQTQDALSTESSRLVQSEPSSNTAPTVDGSGGNTDVDGAQLRSSAASDSLPSVSGSSAAGLVMKARATLAAAATAAAVAGANAGSGGFTLTGLLSPRSSRSGARLCGTSEQGGSSNRQSLERLIGEVGAEPTTQPPAAPAQATAGTAAAVAEADGVAQSMAAPRSSRLFLHSQPYSVSSSLNLKSPSIPNTPTAAYTSATAGDNSGTGAEGAVLLSPTTAPSGSAGPRGPMQPGRQAAVVDAGNALQAASFRLSATVSLVSTQRASQGAISYSVAEGDGGGGGGSNSPMISPLSTIEGRALSRAVHQVAKAFSSPMRPAGAASGANGSTGLEPAAAGTTTQPQNSEANPIVSSRSLPILQALAQGLQNPSRRQQHSSLAVVSTSYASDTRGKLDTISPRASVSSPVANATAAGAAATPSSPTASEATFKQSMRNTREDLHASTSSSATAYATGADALRPSTSLPLAAHRSPPRLSATAGVASEGPLQEFRSAASTPPSWHLGVGLAGADDSGSALSQRLAAMDEALRAIGAV